MATSYAADIAPKFRPKDITCMAPFDVHLGDVAWMCAAEAAFGHRDHGHAREVFERLSEGSMPPDAAWPTAWTDTYRAWMDEGFLP